MIKMKLNILLAERGISQSQLAKATNIRQATIHAYCSHYYKYIAKEHLNTLCNYFNCEITDLIEYVKDKS
jgi:putative transcriptional regulator